MWDLRSHPETALRLLGKEMRVVESLGIELIRQTIAKLDAEAFSQRQAAKRELIGLGPQVLPEVRRGLADPSTSVEVQRSLTQIRDDLEAFEIRDPETLRTVRAVWVLERIGNDAAQELLRKLASGQADARPTQQAKAALTRLEQAAKRNTTP